MKPNTKVIIVISIILFIFITSMAIIIGIKLNSSDNIEDSSNTSEVTPDIEDSSNTLDDVHITTEPNTTGDISNSLPVETLPNNISTESETTTITFIPDAIIPEIDDTIAGVNLAGLKNLTAEQDNSLTRTTLVQLLSNTTTGKEIDYAEVLDTSNDTIVRLHVYFKNGRFKDYVAIFDNINSFNFIRCTSAEEYDRIMNGGNLE